MYFFIKIATSVVIVAATLSPAANINVVAAAPAALQLASVSGAAGSLSE